MRTQHTPFLTANRNLTQATHPKTASLRSRFSTPPADLVTFSSRFLANTWPKKPDYVGILEDNPLNQRLLELLVTSYGYEVPYISKDGQDVFGFPNIIGIENSRDHGPIISDPRDSYRDIVVLADEDLGHDRYGQHTYSGSDMILRYAGTSGLLPKYSFISITSHPTPEPPDWVLNGYIQDFNIPQYREQINDSFKALPHFKGKGALAFLYVAAQMLKKGKSPHGVQAKLFNNIQSAIQQAGKTNDVGAILHKMGGSYDNYVNVDQVDLKDYETLRKTNFIQENHLEALFGLPNKKFKNDYEIYSYFNNGLKSMITEQLEQIKKKTFPLME